MKDKDGKDPEFILVEHPSEIMIFHEPSFEQRTDLALKRIEAMLKLLLEREP